MRNCEVNPGNVKTLRREVSRAQKAALEDGEVRKHLHNQWSPAGLLWKKQDLCKEAHCTGCILAISPCGSLVTAVPGLQIR